METKAYLTPGEFAKAIQTTGEAVRRMCRQGLLAAQKTPGGGRWRIKATELNRWLTGFRDGKEAHHEC